MVTNSSQKTISMDTPDSFRLRFEPGSMLALTCPSRGAERHLGGAAARAGGAAAEHGAGWASILSKNAQVETSVLSPQNAPEISGAPTGRDPRNFRGFGVVYS